jgi:cell division protein FtsW (lipid II flippase)
MSWGNHAFANNRALIWAGAAVVFGCSLLVIMGAPARMPLMNGAAFLIGLALIGILVAAKRLGAGAPLADWSLLCLAVLMPLTAWAGAGLDGVSRWLIIGGITVQPGLIVTPVLAVAFWMRPSAIRLAAVGAASAGLAMQPDPGAAAMLLLGLAAPLLGRAARSRTAAAAVAVALTALIVSLMRAVPLPPVPYVEHMLADAVSGGPLAMLFLALTLVCLFVPAQANGGGRAALGFTGVWAGALAASILGPYPTPVAGFGGSAVLGYVLSVGLLSAIAATESAARTPAKANTVGDDQAKLRFT